MYGYGIQHHVLMVAKKHCDIFPAQDVFQNRDAVRAAVYGIPQDVQVIRIAKLNLAKHLVVHVPASMNIGHHIDQVWPLLSRSRWLSTM